MTTQTEALKLALEALERIDLWLKARYSGIGLVGVELEAITAIKEALSELEQDDEVLGFNGWGFPIEKPNKAMTTQTEALKALVHEMEYVLSCINGDKIPFDGDDFHEALRLGKEALAQPEQDKERCVGCEACIDTACGRDECPKGWPKAPQPEQDNTYTYASSLATLIWQKHYMKDSPKWKPLETTYGVLTQIDNMTCGLVKEKPAQPEQEPDYKAIGQQAYESGYSTGYMDCAVKMKAQPEQEPVAWMTPDGEGFRIRFSPPVNDVPLGWDALYITSPQRTWVGLDEEEIRKADHHMVDGAYHYSFKQGAEWAEAKLKEKNA